jgi:hypothetical protein
MLRGVSSPLGGRALGLLDSGVFQEALELALSFRRPLSSPWIRRPSVVDGSDIVRSNIAAVARLWPAPLKAGGGIALASSTMRHWTSWAQ